MSKKGKHKHLARQMKRQAASQLTKQQPLKKAAGAEGLSLSPQAIQTAGRVNGKKKNLRRP